MRIAASLAMLFASLMLPLFASSEAHAPSDSYMTITQDGDALRGVWKIDLRDLVEPLGLDLDQNGAVTWGELRAREAELNSFVRKRLEIRASGKQCDFENSKLLVEDLSQGMFAVLGFELSCARAIPRELSLSYNLFFDTDAQHRGIVRVQIGKAERLVVFTAEERQRIVALRSASTFETISEFFTQGVTHIWFGFDHLLFLITLLLPAVLRRSSNGWEPRTRFQDSVLETLKIVTAFTIAHSVTLCLVTIGFLRLPSRLVESVIAASIIVAAAANVLPIFAKVDRRWAIAAAFGLIHGCGFASVLADIGLPEGALVSSLLGFNIGVEIGQVAIVAISLPTLYFARQTTLYTRALVPAGSLAAASVAALWLVDRAFALRFMPF